MSEETLITEKPTIEVKWKNKDMIGYYENVPAEEYRKVATRGGFEDCCDIKLVKEMVFSAGSIIDVGAGYGRVINFLLNEGFKGTITALERSKNFSEYLEQSFGNKINLEKSDLMDFEPNEKFDLALYMWSNISEFPKEEQTYALNKIMSFLKPQGTLVMDTILHSIIPKNVNTAHSQYYYIEDQYGVAHGYTPSSEEIDDYAKILNLDVEHIPYQTTTDRPRILHILNRKK